MIQWLSPSGRWAVTVLLQGLVMSQVTPTEHQATPAPGGNRNRATREVASTLVILAGLLGLFHGYFETLQVIIPPSGFFLLAMCPTCQSISVCHTFFPPIP